jgi:hypothetical protein
MASYIIRRTVLNGEGFGIGKFGTKEPFGSMGPIVDAIFPPTLELRWPEKRQGGRILGLTNAVTLSNEGSIQLRTESYIDTSTMNVKSTRSLIFLGD